MHWYVEALRSEPQPDGVFVVRRVSPTTWIAVLERDGEEPRSIGYFSNVMSAQSACLRFGYVTEEVAS